MAHAQVHDDDGIHGINVTPLVDIMLVLLIIFMVATRLEEPGALGVDLPRASTASEPPVSMLSLVIAKDGTLKLDGRAATLPEIEAAAHRASADASAVVSADKGVAYDRVVAVVDAVRRGGVHKLALSAEVDQP
jgi:biopolymer transport protein ExbD